MGQVLHGCATTTEAIRRAIQNSQESLRALARRYGRLGLKLFGSINETTFRKVVLALLFISGAVLVF